MQCHAYVCVRECVRACMCVCARVCARVRVRVHVRVRVRMCVCNVMYNTIGKYLAQIEFALCTTKPEMLKNSPHQNLDFSLHLGFLGIHLSVRCLKPGGAASWLTLHVTQCLITYYEARSRAIERSGEKITLDHTCRFE